MPGGIKPGIKTGNQNGNRSRGETEERAFVGGELYSYHRSQMRSHLLSLALILIAVRVLLATYSVMNRRELENERKLGEVSAKAFLDKLTGAQSINAYRDREVEINARIRSQSMDPFALVVCDVNGLKHVNDTLGHAAGDRYIQSACRLFCESFKNSPVYRIGGDEFVTVLQGQDYEQREELLAEVEKSKEQINQTADYPWERICFAQGIAVFHPESDPNVGSVLKRADGRMYENKAEQKKQMRALKDSQTT